MIIIIQLQPVTVGPYRYYETYNMTDHRKIPIMGQNVEVIKYRVRELFPDNQMIKFEICPEERMR